MRGFLKLKMIGEGRETPVAETEAWFDVLKEIDPDNASTDTLEWLFGLADSMADVFPQYYVWVVEVITRIANSRRHGPSATAWILGRLNGDPQGEVVYRTLQGIWGMNSPSEQIRRKVYELANRRGGERNTGPAPAIETIGKWGLRDKEALNILQRATKNAN